MEIEFSYGAEDERELEKLMRDVLQPYLVRTIHNRMYYYEGDGSDIRPQSSTPKTLYLLMYSYCKTERQTRQERVDVPKTMWGVSTTFVGDRGKTMLQPTGKGQLIFEPKSGVPIAEVVGNSVYVLFNFSARIYKHAQLRNRNRRKVFRHLLKAIGNEVGFILPNMQAFLAGEPFVPPTEQRLEHLRRQKKQAAVSLEHALAKIGANQKCLQELMNADVGNSNQVLQNIARIPEVREVRCEDGILKLKTHTMYYTSLRKRTTYEWGEFSIWFQFGEAIGRRRRTENVTFRNLTRQITFDSDPYGHSHVDRESGRWWCQGSEGEEIDDLISEYDFETAVLFALQAITSVNEYGSGNYYQVMSRFPEVESRQEYPKVLCDISAETEKNFELVFTASLSGRHAELIATIKSLREQVAKDSALIAQTAFLEYLVGVDGCIDSVRSALKASVDSLSKVPGVQSVSFTDGKLSLVADVLCVRQEEASSVVKVTVGFGNDFFVRVEPLETGTEVLMPPALVKDTEGEWLGVARLPMPELVGKLEIVPAAMMVMRALKAA